MNHREEIELLRAALRRRTEETSVRQVAAEAGMSHGGVHNFVTRGDSPYGKTLAKLRAWYLHQAAAGGEPLSAAAAGYLIEQMLAPIAPREQRAARGEILNALDTVYRKYSTSPPAWLYMLREEPDADAP